MVILSEAKNPYEFLRDPSLALRVTRLKQNCKGGLFLLSVSVSQWFKRLLLCSQFSQSIHILFQYGKGIFDGLRGCHVHACGFVDIHR